jgi:GNAT superfamily N-acetyltransferase
MARTEAGVLSSAPLVELGEADVPDALSLSREAGWNQTGQDWSLMIRLGRAFGIPGPDRRLVATGLALPYPPDFGWISMVLVHGPYRRRGLATRLLERAIATLRDRGLVPLLDATQDGRAVYEPLGFRPVETLSRWRGQGGGGAEPPAHASRLPSLAPIGELDAASFGADRSAVLADLLDRGAPVALLEPAGNGFLLSRNGRTATQLGPLVARDPGAAADLLEAGLAAVSGAVLVDVPDRQLQVAQSLAARGFTAERSFVRMALGRDVAFGDPGAIHAVAGPELG